MSTGSFFTSVAFCRTERRYCIYSIASFKMFTFDIFLSAAAVGMCFLRVSNPLFTDWTRVRSLSFLLIVFRSCWGFILYPCTGWYATNFAFGAIFTVVTHLFTVNPPIIGHQLLVGVEGGLLYV